MYHLDDDTIKRIETILWSNERPSRGRFHEGRGENYRTHGVEMKNISEIGLCSGHSASGVLGQRKEPETTVPGSLRRRGHVAKRGPHNYMIWGLRLMVRIAGEKAKWALTYRV